MYMARISGVWIGVLVSHGSLFSLSRYMWDPNCTNTIYGALSPTNTSHSSQDKATMEWMLPNVNYVNGYDFRWVDWVLGVTWVPVFIK